MIKKLYMGTAVVMAAVVCSAHAEEPYPTRPIKLVLGFPPGGSVDGIARAFGEELAGKMKQPIIVENRPGAGTTIAADMVFRSDPDGYTLYVGGVGVMGGDNALYKSLHYSPADFRPITQLTTSPMVFVTAASSSFHSVQDVIAAAKKKPGDLTYSSSGAGAPTHLAAALFLKEAGVQLLHIPYKGGSQSATAVAAGDVDVSFATPQSVLPLIDAGKLRALAVTAPTPMPELAKVPTIKESGVPSYKFDTWWGLYAPVKTPEAIVQQLFKASSEVLHSEKLQQLLLLKGEEVSPSSSPEAFKTFAGADGKEIVKLIKYSGAQVN